MKKFGLGKIECFCNQVNISLGENVTIRDPKHHICIQCKDLEEVAFKGKIFTALKEHLKLKSIVSLGKSYGNMVLVVLLLKGHIVTTSAGSAEIVVCQKWMGFLQSFKCLIVKHFTKTRTKGIDRSDRCKLNGKEGHITIEGNRKDSQLVNVRNLGM